MPYRRSSYIQFGETSRSATTGKGNVVKKPKSKRSTTPDNEGTVTVNAGTADSLPAGSSPTVTNSGTTKDAVFNFGIPKGDKGDNAVNPNFTASGESCSPSQDADADLIGTYPNLHINFLIPRGHDGMGTIAIGQTTTLPSGSSASVTNSGTAQDAILNFAIPQGQDGQGGGGGGYYCPCPICTNQSTGGGSGIEDAPSDGNIYGRQNGGWVQIG